MDPCLLLVGPAVIALFAVAWAVRLGRQPSERAQTSGRLVGSYVLLAITFGIGTCYGSLMLRSVRVGWAGAVLLLGLAISYLVAIHRLPRDDARLREAFDVEVPHSARWPAMVALVLL